MDTKRYALLYFQLGPKQIWAKLVGTQIEVVETDIRKAKSAIRQKLQRDYKRYNYSPNVDLIEPRLKVFEVRIRPSYQTREGTFPSTRQIKIPVLGVFGSQHEGHYRCYFPLFDGRLNYYDPRQLNTLVQYFATTELSKLTPEEIYRYARLPEPQLEEVTLRVNPEKEHPFALDFGARTAYEKLQQVAEAYPYAKAQQKNISAFPDAAWEMDNQVNQLIDAIMITKANVLLVGDAGVGKSAVIKQAIRKIVGKSAQDKGPSFWKVMAQRLTANARYLGEWQQNLEEIITELSANQGVLWVVDAVRLIQIGGEGPEDSVAAFLHTFLQTSQVQIVGEVTPEALESMRRLLPGFVEQFQCIELHELPEEKIFTILEKIQAYARQSLQVSIDSSALELSYRLLKRYYSYEQFPGKAVKFLAQCVSTAQLEERTAVKPAQIIAQLIEQTGMPELFLRDDWVLEDSHLQAFFTQRIIGQPEAIATLTNVVKIFKAGLNNPQRPISTMLFVGPTGVGKTASAKALSNYFFGKGQLRTPLVRIDMSEFQHPSHLARFIGIGNEVGQLVKEIRERPFSVLLLDEIEKADPSVFDALLTVLDEGRLVDNFGRVTNFRNTVIIMTSNIGASNRQSIGFGGGNNAAYLSALEKYFRPEFLNRIDHIVQFNALSPSDIQEITHKELQALNQREGIQKRNIQLKFGQALKTHLAAIGFDARYGARPLQRAIENELVTGLARWLATHPVQDVILSLDWINKQLQIKKATE